MPTNRIATSTHIAPITGEAWPTLPLAEWRETYTTLHRWLQIVGKTRLALAPMQNRWWQTTLYVAARGLGTSPMPYGTTAVEVELDFVDHALSVRTSCGETGSLELVPHSVADFYREYMALLNSLGVRPRIWPVPVELPDRLRLDQDETHRAYDPDAAQRCWRVRRRSETSC